ncbi:LysR family transcriptional regulator [Leuconostoc pseudomesenteroides]|uniref:LysR family transcriptional regulator n=1 Tax=Leuconostoc pseudomesenteroides TaxID=33968 RepID=UPI00301E4489
MNTKLLSYFLTVVREGNISKAAEKLHMTQPTLSRQLMKLESTMDSKLFTRGKKTVTLTSDGILLAKKGQEILDMVDTTFQEIQQNHKIPHGVVRIGVVETSISTYLSTFITEFQKKFPQISFDFYNADGNDIKDRLDGGTLDLGFLIEPIEVAKYHTQIIGTQERWGIVLEKVNQLAQQNEISSTDLFAQPVILPRRSIIIDNILDTLHVKIAQLNIVSTHNLLTNSLSILKKQHALLISVEGALTIRPDADLTFLPFENHIVSNHVLVWRKNIQLSTEATAFLQYLVAKTNI